ncbi:MAG: shikimate dehydrogenase [Epsilonproteobacteria bacterium]|nr:shikimate dehydrogenase [Campylobacterota bacterium]
MSPSIQNRLFKKHGVNAVYIPMQTGDLRAAVSSIRVTENFMGANITIPYKETIIPLLDEISEDARFCGAVNTIYKNAGRLCGANSDIDGFKKALKYDLGFDIKNGDAAILGTGGAARAVIAAIGNLAKSITIISRNRSSAETLIEQFSGRVTAQFYVKGWDDKLNVDLIINATPIGLNGELLPVNFGKSALFDLAYSKNNTPIVALFKKCGNNAIDGKQMLNRQAEISFTIWQRFGDY